MPLTRLPLTTGVSGTLPVGNGGTNVTTTADLQNIGNLVLLETTTVTSVSSITVGASAIDDTYEQYQIVVSDVKPATDGAHGRMRFTIGGTEQSGASDYSRVEFRMYAGSASGGFYVNDGNASYVDMVMGESIGNDANHGNNLIMNIFRPSASSHHTYGFSHLI